MVFIFNRLRYGKLRSAVSSQPNKSYFLFVQPGLTAIHAASHSNEPLPSMTSMDNRHLQPLRPSAIMAALR
jgi:hypothetical protein